MILLRSSFPASYIRDISWNIIIEIIIIIFGLVLYCMMAKHYVIYKVYDFIFKIFCS